MKTLMLLSKSAYSIDAIFELRKTPIILTVLIGLLLSMLQMTPFAFSFLKTETYRWDEKMWVITKEEQQEIMNSLPDCSVSEGQLSCDESVHLKIRDQVQFSFNTEIEDKMSGVNFNKDHFVFSDGASQYPIGYAAFEGFEFGQDADYDELFNRVAVSIKPIFVLPLIMGSYLTGVLVFYIYIVIVAMISMLLKFGHTHFISFKEVFNIMVYSSVASILVSLIIGLVITPAFGMIIFQFGTPLMAYMVYRKKVITSLHSIC